MSIYYPINIFPNNGFVNSMTLQSLDFGFMKSTFALHEIPNLMRDEGAKYVSQFIENNKSVKLLNIAFNEITNDGLTLVADSMLKNDTILYFRYDQHRLTILPDINSKINDKLKENVQNNLGINWNTFHSNVLRYIRHSKKVKNIDSDYRNKM